MNVPKWHPGDVIVFRHVETPTTIRMLHAINGDPVAPGGGKGEPFLINGEVVTVGARPYRVIVDSEDLLALHQPEGTLIQRWHIAEQRLLPDASYSRGETLRLLKPGHAYDVTLFFETEGELPWFYDALFGAGRLQAPGWRARHRNSEDPAIVSPVQPTGHRFRGWYVNMHMPFVRTAVGIDVVDLTLDIVVRPDGSWYWKDADELAMAMEKGACSVAYAEAIRKTGETVARAIEARQQPFDDTWTSWRPSDTSPITQVPDGWQHLPVVIPD